VFFVSQAGISLLGEVNRIVTMVDNQRSCGAKIAGFEFADLKPDRCVALRPKRVILHLTEDRAPPFISNGNQRLRYYRQAYPSLVCSIVL
jgi:hypothetical protein